MAALPPLKPSAWDLTLNINFGHIWDHHHPNVRHTDPYASYFAHGLTSNAALLHLSQLVQSQGLEVSRCIVKGEPESERIFFCWHARGLVWGWGGLSSPTHLLPAGKRWHKQFKSEGPSKPSDVASQVTVITKIYLLSLFIFIEPCLLLNIMLLVLIKMMLNALAFKLSCCPERSL